MGRFRSKLDTLRQTYRLCRLGGMPEPKWLAPFIRLSNKGKLNHNSTEGGRSSKTRRVEFPEDRLIQSFYDRYPLASLMPVDVANFEPPPVKKMAVRQLALMEQGVPRKKAQKVVEDQMLASGELKKPSRPSVIAQIQADEERALMAAIQERTRAANAAGPTR